MLRLIKNSLLCLLLVLVFADTKTNLSASYMSDNDTFYSLYRADYRVKDNAYVYYVSGEYFESKTNRRLDLFTGLDFAVSEKIVPFIFVNYFYNDKLTSDYLRTGIGSYYMLDEFIVKHRISLAIVSETGKDRHLLSWRYRAWQEYGNLSIMFVVNIIEHDNSQKLECSYKLTNQVRLSYTYSNFNSSFGNDVSTMIGVNISF